MELTALLPVSVTKNLNAILGLNLALAVAWLSSSGCAARQSSAYQLVAQGQKAILIPPGPAPRSGKPRQVTIRTLAGGVDCALQERSVRVEKRGRSLHITTRRNSLPTGSPGWLARWADTLSDNGCLPRSQAGPFARRVMESFPLELSNTYTVAFGKSRNAGFIDFHPGHHLKVVRPVFREGAEAGQSVIVSADAPQPNGAGGLRIEARASRSLIGYEESWYSIQAMPNGLLQITHDHTKFFQDGEATRRDVPQEAVFDVVPASPYIRMVYLTRVASSHDHDVLFLVASSRRELETRFRAIQEDPNECFGLDSSVWCRVGPRELALNLYVKVTVNGVEAPVAPGTLMGRFLSPTMVGREDGGLHDLHVLRPYGNRLARIEFDRSSRAILSLPLLGGERISLPSVGR